jgi:PAS domain S-box-containing protein
MGVATVSDPIPVSSVDDDEPSVLRRLTSADELVRSVRSSRPSPPRCRVLLVDDEPTQLTLSRVRLEDAGYLVETASNADEALEKTKLAPPDAIMSDVLMDGLDGFGFCRKLREDSRLASVPVLLLSAHCDGPSDSELSARVGAARMVARTPDFSAELAALRAVLADRCVAKPDAANSALYERLLRRNAKQITRLLGEAQTAEERYRTLFSHANDAITFLTPDGVILEANERWRSLLGIEPKAMVGRHIRDFSPAGTELANEKDFERTLKDESGRSGEVPLLRADGSVMFAEFSLSAVDIAGQPTVLAIGRDVTIEMQARRALAMAEERYRTLVERIPDVVWTATLDGVLVFATQNIVRVLGYTLEELNRQNALEPAAIIHPDDRATLLEGMRRVAEAGTFFDLEYRVRHKDGRYLWVRDRITAAYERDGVRYVEGMVSDINERKLLEESLLQAQKMEAIGQLTGGIAHDFNNVLAAILANSYFLIESLGAQDPRRSDAEEIRVAAERAAGLTRQLLAFGRRQVLQPAVVDLNVTVAGLQKMLCRVIGEDITLAVVPGVALGSTRVDVGQLEQVVMNLVVNARDAMPTGGKISIETANVDIDAEQIGSHSSVTPGRYVVLTVSDTGTGMDETTKRRLFEPFFTTKELGRGTGLGLSTCYGIVNQSGGHIAVESEIGHGSAFKVYLPRVDQAPAPLETGPLGPGFDGWETVVLVEDDQRVRVAVRRMLEALGYRVLVARDGAEARALLETERGPIHLVLTDMVMPGASGPEVAAMIQGRFGSKVLFMSGYTDHPMLRSGVTQNEHRFIQKPFSPEALAKKLREVLDAPTSA